MKKPLISVCMTLFNHEKFVGEAIKSVLSQSYKNFEFLIIDDCSTDNSLQIVKSFNDKRLRYYKNNENSGTIISLNKILKKIKGDYIAIIDSDDIWFPNKLEYQISYMLRHPEYGATFTQANIVDEFGKKYPKNKNADLGINVYMQNSLSSVELLRRFYDKGNCLAHPSMMMKREVLQVIGFHDIRFRQLHDLEFYSRLILDFDCKIIQKVLLNVRRLSKNNDSVSSLSMENAIRSRNESTLLVYNMIKNCPKDLFLLAFSDKIIFTVKDNLDLICEKYFILKNWCMDDVNNLLPAIVFLSNYINDKKILNRLHTKYNYSINDYYNDTAKIIKLYKPYYDPSIKKELDLVYDSTSWKVTKPLRFIKDIFKKEK